ncbi:MAG TPA: DUF1801 domain-containing protein [Chthoniobacterales bacterium]
MTKSSVTFNNYVARFPPKVRRRLRELRQTIMAAAPEAVETISYQMPAFRLDGVLVYFAGFKNHIGFYPRTSAIVKFSKELAKYEHAKGSVRFPHDEPLPLSLVTRMVEFRKRENRAKAKGENKK